MFEYRPYLDPVSLGVDQVPTAQPIAEHPRRAVRPQRYSVVPTPRLNAREADLGMVMEDESETVNEVVKSKRCAAAPARRGI